jgi:long-subunit acyl-CoA synthetase (AMP-forming)
MLAARSVDTYGLDHRYLILDVAALRLTARDVAAGAVSNEAELDSVLNTTHSALREQRAAR